MDTTKPRTSGAPPLPPPPNPTASTSEPPPPPGPTPRRRSGGGGTKRKANNSHTSSASKRFAREKAFLQPHHLHNGPITRARQSPNKLAAAAAAATASAAVTSSSSVGVGGGSSSVQQQGKEFVVPLPGGERTGSSAQEALVHEESQVPVEPEIDKEFEAIRSRDPNAHVVPTPAAWFSWTETHPLEERTLVSFFNGKSEKRTSETYMEIRNSIMRKFHTDPTAQINPKDLSEMSAGELDARQEIMEFLDHWGLINFHPFPVGECKMVETETDGSTSMTSLIEKLYQFEVVQPRQRLGPKVDLSMQAMVPRLLPESTVVDEVRQEGPAVEYHCNSCSTDCSRKRYHCQKQADFDLCSECYNNGKFDSGMSRADFILMEPAEVPGVSGGSWTDQETLLLLEALEIFGENNWNEIAEHVATKSKAQCILHFIQMPIEDTFLEGEGEFDASPQGKTDPVSTNDDSSIEKKSHETMETKAVTDNGTSPTKETPEIAMNNDPSTANRSPEITPESKSVADKEVTLSPKVDSSEKKDGSGGKTAEEVNVNYAVNALKEAFQAVGSLFGPGESLSFADAGNPVMALAAYLAALVEPDISAASARSSLKAASEDSPGIHLAMRHCFLLGDPPEDVKVKETHASERDCSSDVAMLEAEAHKDENSKEENHQEEKTELEGNQAVLEGSDVYKDCSHEKIEGMIPKETMPLTSPQDEKIEDMIPKETMPLASPRDEKIANLCDVKESDDATNKEKDATNMEKDDATNMEKEKDPSSTVKESNDPTLPGSCQSSTMNRTSEPALPLPSEAIPSSEKKSEGLASLEEISKCPEVPKDVDIVSNSGLSEDKDFQTVTPNSAVENESNPGESVPGLVDDTSEKTSNLSQTRDESVPGVVDNKSEKTSNLSQTRDESVPGMVGHTGENTSNLSQTIDDQKHVDIVKHDGLATQTRDDQNANKVKHAALTALSAAAVKAKLLADQEEVQIRQLATFLIDKQLHKLETKLVFFSEMESMMMRAREQIMRSRERLYQERSQIIASRLGLSASSSRAGVQPPLPNNRVAMSYANSVPRSLPR